MKKVKDLVIEGGMGLEDLTRKLGTTGFQATEIQNAKELINQMKDDKYTVFLTFTANMMASGLRGVLTQMVESGNIDAVITTGGSLDHDIIRSYKPYLIGSFSEDDILLHKNEVNRIGNILVPNDRYLLLEKKANTYYNQLYKKGKTHTPVEVFAHIGSKLPKGSFLRACYDKQVPVFCPGYIDSALGMHLFFFTQDRRNFSIDPAKDMQALSDLVFRAKKTAGIVLGGGISKHHLIGANLLRGGLDLAVYVTTATEFDGSLSGAKAKEAKSWGKITEKAKTATVYCDATLALPLIASDFV